MRRRTFSFLLLELVAWGLAARSLGHHDRLGCLRRRGLPIVIFGVILTGASKVGGKNVRMVFMYCD